MAVGGRGGGGGSVESKNRPLVRTREAKVSSDDLNKEIRAKLEKGYQTDNLLFWEPRRAVLYQHGQKLLDVPIDEPVALLGLFSSSLILRLRPSRSGKAPCSRTRCPSSAKRWPAS
jgi:hypothetical protein